MRDLLQCAALPLALALAIACAAAAAAAASDRSPGCSVDLREDVAEKEPLILQKECAKSSCAWKLLEGDEDNLYFENGEEVLIACPDKNNKFENVSSQPKSILVVCTGKQDSSFEVDGKKYTIKDFACEKIAKGEILSKNISCGPRKAELLEVGFTVREVWYPLIKICHVKSRSDTLFTEHVLQGESTKKRRPTKRPAFEEGTYYEGFSANDAYKNANRTLRELTGYYKFPNSVSTSIDRGHLSPDGDFPISPYRYSTYFYVNTVPMWGVVNRGNWGALEGKIRTVAKNTKVDLHITTGVFRVVELTDINGNSKELFLHSTYKGKQLPVPKFLWKVAYDENNHSGIAFVVLNYPFKVTINSEDELCPNLCKESGWHDNKWKIISKGYLYCCEVKQLKKFISYLPKYDIRSILRGPHLLLQR